MEKILKPTRINSYDSYFIYFQYANWQQRKNINIHEYPALMPLQDSFFLFVFVSLFCSTSVNFQTHYPTTVELNFFGRWTNWAACHSAGILLWLRHKTWQRVRVWKFGCIAAATPPFGQMSHEKKNILNFHCHGCFNKDPYNGSIVIPRKLCSTIPLKNLNNQGPFFHDSNCDEGSSPLKKPKFFTRHPTLSHPLLGEGRGFWKKNKL